MTQDAARAPRHPVTGVGRCDGPAGKLYKQTLGRHAWVRAVVRVARVSHPLHADEVQHLVAILVACAVATTSLPVGDTCPMARGVARCCCPHGLSDRAAITCCGDTQRSGATQSARDRQDDRVQLVGVLVPVPWY